MKQLKRGDIIIDDWKESALNSGTYYAPDLTELGKELYDRSDVIDSGRWGSQRRCSHKGYVVIFNVPFRSDYSLPEPIKVKIRSKLWRRAINFICKLLGAN